MGTFITTVFFLGACTSGSTTSDSGGDSESDTGSTSGTDTGTQDTDTGALDTDGDGYTDAEELQAGTDPEDPDSVIYQGGWPYNLDKDAIEDPGWDSEGGEGATIPEYIAVDQFGDQVNLYDFAGRGRPIVLDVGTKWCVPCQALAEYLATGDSTHLMEEYEQYWWKAEYEGLAELVQTGEISWVTVLFSTSESHGPATTEDAAEWHSVYENPMIPILADTDLTLYDYLDIQSYPAISILNEDMQFEVFDNSSPYPALGYLGDLLAAGR